MRRPKIFFITGVNGSGKSTLVPWLRKLLPAGYRVYDFDQHGVPKNVDAKWLLRKTNYWLHVAYQNARKNLNTVVCGYTKPGEIHQLARKSFKNRIAIALLDVSNNQINLRLRRRNSIKNLEETAGISLRDCVNANIMHAREMRRQCKMYQCKNFNTSATIPKKTAIKVVGWIITL